jgi:hypothetical protein
MKKLSNKILIITLLVLAVGFVLSRLFRSPGLESNLRKDLMQLDTAKITEVRILPSGHRDEELKLVREGYHWKVSKGKQQSQSDEALVRSLLSLVRQVKAQRMVTHKKERSEEFNVGEKSTHVSIYQNSTKKVDFQIGKTGFTSAADGSFSGGYTYLRLTDENEVYAVEGFFESGFNRAYNDWRDKTLVRLRKEDINKIFFHYPSDTGFVAEKRDSVWYVTHLGIDAGLINTYLARLSSARMNEFADGFVPPHQADVIIQINGSRGSDERVEGWKGDGKWTVTSSLQKGVYFSGTETAVKELFISKKKLIR